MGVFSGAGGVVVLAVLVVLVGLVAVVGLALGLHRRDMRRRTFAVDAWAAAGYGIPQAALDRALAAADPYPTEGTTPPKRTANDKTATKTTAAKQTTARNTTAKKATARKR